MYPGRVTTLRIWWREAKAALIRISVPPEFLTTGFGFG
jgi:hypothetical protein